MNVCKAKDYCETVVSVMNSKWQLMNSPMDNNNLQIHIEVNKTVNTIKIMFLQ